MRTLIESYYFLFFRLYRWYRKHFGLGDLPHLNATLILGILAVLNWMSFVFGFRVVTGYQIMQFSRTSATVSVFVIGALMFAIFFINQRYKDLIARFEKKDLEVQPAVKVLSMAYPVATFILLFLAVFFAWGINNR